jgi:hypothetical protein
MQMQMQMQTLIQIQTRILTLTQTQMQIPLQMLNQQQMQMQNLALKLEQPFMQQLLNLSNQIFKKQSLYQLFMEDKILHNQQNLHQTSSAH